MSGSECSTYSNRNVLYKVFIHRGSDKNALIEKHQLEEMFATLVEPFKVNVHHTGEYGFAYFGSKRDAQACIVAFHKQPPFHYNVYVGSPETYVMNAKDLKKMNFRFEYQSRRLKIIEREIRKLLNERSKIINDLGSVTDFESSDSDFSEDIHPEILRTLHNTENSSSYNTRGRSENYEEFQKDRVRTRSHSRSRLASCISESEKITDRRQSNNFNGKGHRNRYSMPSQKCQSTSSYENKEANGMAKHNAINSVNKYSRHSISSNTNQNSPRVSTKYQNRNNHTRNNNNEDDKEVSSNNTDKFLQEIPSSISVPRGNASRNSQISSVAPSASKNNLPDNRQCIASVATLSQTGTLKLRSIIDSDTSVAQCTIASREFGDYAQTIQNLWTKYPTKYINPEVGDLVCIENDEEWARGYVVSKSGTEYQVALIDEGIFVNNITKCCKLTSEHASIPDCACLCQVIQVLCDLPKFAKLFNVDKTYGFEITSVGVDDRGAQYLKCLIKDRKTKENLFEVKLSRWMPTFNTQKELPHNDKARKPLERPKSSQSQPINQVPYDGIIPKTNLPNGSFVIISLAQSQHIVYAQYRESNQHLSEVTNLLESSISNLKPMTAQSARIGHCVAAQFSEDKLWYRAEILSIKNDIATVLYIDYGNKEKVPVNQTKMLSKQLLDIPRAITEIKLHGLPDKPLTLQQTKYLKQCVKMKFKLVIDALKKDVCLVNVKNEAESLNDQLKSLNVVKEIKKDIDEAANSANIENKVTPTPKDVVLDIKDDEPTEILFKELPLGKTKIVLQKVIDAEDRIIICYPYDLDNLMYIQSELTEKINEFVINNTKEKFYKPTASTACLAKFEDSWYRAICLDIEDESAIVMFVDFGNHEKVEFTKIRKLPKQFAKDPAIALICTVIDVPSDVTESALLESLQELEEYEVDVLEKEDVCQYKIRIPGLSAVN